MIKAAKRSCMMYEFSKVDIRDTIPLNLLRTANSTVVFKIEAGIVYLSP